MSVQVQIVEGPLVPTPRRKIEGAGALVEFEGIVRGQEEGRAIAALEYQVYEPMASRELVRLAEELIARHGVIEMSVEHSRGSVRVGECSFRLRVWAKHRKEALAAMDEFIDRMKRDVPIWKSAVGQ